MYVVGYSLEAIGRSFNQHPNKHFETEELAFAEAQVQAEKNKDIYWWVHEVNPNYVRILKNPIKEKVYAEIFN